MKPYRRKVKQLEIDERGKISEVTYNEAMTFSSISMSGEEIKLHAKERAGMYKEHLAKSDAEIARNNATMLDAVRGTKQLNTCKRNAPKGGKASALYTDAEVIEAFTAFKRRNPKKTSWDAAGALIRDGQELEKYAGTQGPWKRIERMSAANSVTVNEWYSSL